MNRPVVRCAVYTRKSTEEGLDQAFNSLHAQREACEAYIKSQVAEGWKLIPTAYDDGGFSGGNTDRPALQKLLSDVDAGKIDVIVVYKIDRLTRALSDFARIVERLDKRGASFVSVTQAFNTTTSMGRLTLNVLLSFAQFEREVTGERIRDKVTASKKKGMWMGGVPPLGYGLPTDPVTRALVVDPEEAAQVRTLFERYLELGSVSALEARLAKDGWRTRVRVSAGGRQSGGVPFSRGALFHLLKNRIYLGEIAHAEGAALSAHPAIIGPDLFDQVQKRLSENTRAQKERPLRSAELPLKGLVFDADGHRMSPSFGYGRGGQIYRYYVSAPLQQGRSITSATNALRRVKAEALDEVVRRAVAELLRKPEATSLPDLVAGIGRVDVLGDEVRVALSSAQVPQSRRRGLKACIKLEDHLVLSIPVRCQTRGGGAWAVGASGEPVRASARRNPTLIKGLRRAHRIMAAAGWRAADGSVSDVHMSSPTNAYDRKLCRLALLAPDIQGAILEGRQPPALSLDQLLHATIPTSWSEQRKVFGFGEQPG